MTHPFDYHKIIEDLTDIQMTYEDSYKILAHTVEELGEVAGAMAVEDAGVGKSYKPTPNEPSYTECVDLAVCALSLFYARGGTKRDFLDIIERKLTKWEVNQAKSIGDIMLGEPDEV
jgi:hypothetical protein